MNQTKPSGADSVFPSGETSVECFKGFVIARSECGEFFARKDGVAVMHGQPNVAAVKWLLGEMRALGAERI